MTFSTKLKYIFLAGLLSLAPPQLSAAELVMVERPGCSYCAEWKWVIGPIYPKTAAGNFAPLVVVDITDEAPFEGGYNSPIVYTPTFVIVDNGQEVGRILGYPGEIFFWPILEGILADKTGFSLENGS